MRFSERNGRDGGMDETATGFIDIQFGLIAILILLLSTAVTGIGNLSNQLKGVEGGMAGVIGLLLCDWNETPEICEPELNLFSGQTVNHPVSLRREGEELVLVLGLADYVQASADPRAIGLFRTGSNDLPLDIDGQQGALSTFAGRVDVILPCVAPLARNVPIESRIAIATRSQEGCPRVLNRLREVAPGGGPAPGVDLFQIEGHGDWSPAGERDALIAVERAQAVLLRLLRAQAPPVAPSRTNEPRQEITLWINGLTQSGLSLELDKVMSLPEDQLTDLTALFWLAPLGARITEECRLGRELGQVLPDWCQVLLPTAVSPIPSPGGQQEMPLDSLSRLPKLFAMTSYGRYSLRYGGPGDGDPRDRRVEFRLRGSIIPTAVHNLFTDPDGPYYNNTNLFRLYSTDAVQALHQCDATRGRDETCLDALDDLVTVPD